MLKRNKIFLSALFAFCMAVNSTIMHAEVEKYYNDATTFDPTTISLTAVASDIAYGAGVPVGTVVAWPHADLPNGSAQSACIASASSSDALAHGCEWLICDGSTINSTAYPALAAIVGTTLPDYRGIFLRGYGSQVHSQENGSTIGTTSTTHTSGSLGAVQGDAIRNITATLSDGSPSLWNQFIGTIWNANGAFLEDTKVTTRRKPNYDSDRYANGNSLTFNASRVVPTGGENRPVNIAVHYIIKAY